MQGTVFEPLGMQDSCLRLTPADYGLLVRRVTGRAWLGGSIETLQHKFAALGHGDALATSG